MTRKFADDKAKNVFLKGVNKILPKAAKFRLARLSFIKENSFGFNIISTWGLPNRTPMKVIKLFHETNNKDLTDADWTRAGEYAADQLLDWASSEEEFATLERKAAAQQFNVWDTTEKWELAQDLIAEFEILFGSYIGGKLHWKAKAELSRMIEALSNRVEQECHDKKSNIKSSASTNLVKEKVNGNS